MRKTLLFTTSFSILVVGTFLACSSSDPAPAPKTDAGTDGSSSSSSSSSGGSSSGGSSSSSSGSSSGDAGGDSGASALCNQYCNQLEANCKAGNAQYATRQDCLDKCKTFTVGNPADTSGDTLYCRIYHGGAPAAADPDTHCEHAGPDGTGACE